MSRTLDVFTSYLASVIRLGAGLSVRGAGKRPERTLELYEFEACPFCRRVREALSALDLEALVYPCPRPCPRPGPQGGSRYRPRAQELGGKEQFPFLVDANTGARLYESADIIRYLARTYGAGRGPLLFGPLGLLGSGLASAVRGRGRRARPSRAPERPLTLWSFEASAYCRIVRERLCELELPYHLINVAKGSAARTAFVARSGKMMVPYLEDPNTGTAMFESADIAAYLERTYAA